MLKLNYLIRGQFRRTFIESLFTFLTQIFLFQFDRGVYSLMGSVDPESFDTLHSFSNAFEMPFVTPWYPEKVPGREKLIKS